MKNTISKEHFEHEMARAKTMQGLDTGSAEYWIGYQRGLRRAHHEERFGTEAEHRLWLAAASDSDQIRQQRGIGYQDGLRGRSKQEPGADHKQDTTGRKPKGSSALDRLDAARENLDRQIEEYDAGR